MSMSVAKILVGLLVLVVALFYGGHMAARMSPTPVKSPAENVLAGAKAMSAEATAVTQAALGAKPAAAPVHAGGPSGIAGVRKCKGAQGTVYTSDNCPKGMQEVRATGGTVTVVAGQAVAPAAAQEGTAGGKTVMDKLAGPPLPSRTEKVLEQATNPRSP
jgi:hypothetical protein